VAEISGFPTASAVAIGALPGIVICRTLVAGFAVHIRAVIYGTFPFFSIVTLRAGSGFMIIWRGVAGETICRVRMIEIGIAPPFGIMAAGAFPGIVLFRLCMARQAIGITSVVEPGHHPVTYDMAVSAGARIVILRGILGVAIAALPVEVMVIIVVAPIAAGVVTAAAVLAVVIVGGIILVAFHALLDSGASMFKLGSTPGIGIMTLAAPPRGVLGWR
jgi:hypothetical protein